MTLCGMGRLGPALLEAAAVLDEAPLGPPRYGRGGKFGGGADSWAYALAMEGFVSPAGMCGL